MAESTCTRNPSRQGGPRGCCVITPPLVPKHDGALPRSTALLPRPYPLCLKGLGPCTASSRVIWHRNHGKCITNTVVERRISRWRPAGGSSPFQNQGPQMPQPSLLRHPRVRGSTSNALSPLKLPTRFLSSSRTTV